MDHMMMGGGTPGTDASGLHSVGKSALLGVGLGALAAIGPDHMCTLATLTMGRGRGNEMWPAIKVGVSWSIGHSFGMVTTCLLAIVFQLWARIDQWSRYGDYLAGALMIFLGIYFLCKESQYLEKGSDGKFVAKPCCSGHGHGHGHGHVHGSSSNEQQEGEGESQPLVGPPRETSTFRADVWGAVVGLVQGMLCPSCLLGVSFAGQFSSATPTGCLGISVFVAALLVCSSFCTALVLFVMLSGVKAFGDALSLSMPIFYRGSCVVTITMGVSWMALAHYGGLHFIDYGDELEHHAAHSLFEG